MSEDNKTIYASTSYRRAKAVFNTYMKSPRPAFDLKKWNKACDVVIDDILK